MPAKSTPNIACCVCGKRFHRKPSHIAANNFCSRNCVSNKWPTLVRQILGSASDACLLWKGPADSGGYGRVKVLGVSIRIHRLAFEIANGPIGDGLHVLHRCDTPTCFNPAHLFLGTQASNNADRDEKGRQSKGTSRPLAKLTDEIVRTIRNRYASGNVSHRQLASEYGVTKSVIDKLLYRHTWKHVN